MKRIYSITSIGKKYLSRTVALLLVFVLAFGMISSASAASGTPMYKWEKWSTTETTAYSFHLEWVYDGSGCHYFSVVHLSEGAGTYYSSCDVSTGSAVYSGGAYCADIEEAYLSGHVYYGTSTSVAVVTCYHSSMNYNDTIEVHPHYIKGVPYTTYSKGNFISNVYSTSSSSYPSNSYQLDSPTGTYYWYVSSGLCYDTSTITFDSNGGSAITSQSVYYGNMITKPTPTRTGYTFVGWYSNSGLTSAWNFSTRVNSSAITLYAKWRINQYNVTFDTQGGSAVNTQSFDYGSLITEPAEPTRTGYTFAGWYSDSGLTSPWDFASDTLGASDVTLYAAWTANTYRVNFDAQGGNCPTSSITVTYDSTYGTLPEPARTGYSFIGWFTDVNDAGTKILSSTTVGITSDLTLYASWSANSYAVSFDAQGGACSTNTITVTYDSTYGILPTPTRTGYTFDGWFTEADGAGVQILSTTTVSITSDRRLYAAWSVDQYTVTFDSNGGTAVASQTLDYGSLIALPDNPTLTGYSFGGWYSDSGLTTAWNFSANTLGAADMTLYASWTINQYTVSFESNGGTAVDSQTLNYGSLVVEPTEPTQTGYTFDGWYSESGLTTAWDFSSDTLGAADMTLYAAWTADTYTVTFDAQGGTCATSSITATYDSAYGSLPEPTLTGYTFVGWFTEVDGAGLEITDTTIVNITEDLTLYAYWTYDQYVVVFYSNGGSSVEGLTLHYGDYIPEPESPTKEGHTFIGWYSDTALTTAWDFNANTLGTSDLALYAGWDIKQYTVTFESNGGTAIESQTLDYGSEIFEPEEPTRSGYDFRGWYYDAELTSSVAWPVTLGATDLTLYANWAAHATAGSGAAGTAAEGNDSNEAADDATVITYVIEGKSSSETVNSGSEISEPEAPMKTGYTFTGWYYDTEMTSPVSWPITAGDEDVTIYAAWDINQYTVTYEDLTGVVLNYNVLDYGSEIQEPVVASDAGYVITGWYYDAELTKPVSWPFKLGASDIVVYAHYTNAANSKPDSSIGKVSSEPDTDDAKKVSVIKTVKYFTLIFNSDGGNTVSSQTAVSGSEIAEPEAPTKAGYNFDGWYHDADLTNLVSWPITLSTNETLYAAWKAAETIPVPATITQEKDDGSKDISSLGDSDSSINFTLLTVLITLAVILFSIIIMLLILRIRSGVKRRRNDSVMYD